MKHQRINYISAAIVILLTCLFRLLLLWMSFYSLTEYNKGVSNSEQLPLSEVLNFLSLFPPIILFAEAVLYVVFRNRLFKRRFVRLHIWTTILSSIIFPIVEILVIALVLPKSHGPSKITAIEAKYNFSILLFGWALFALARLFFITAMVKSVTSLNESIQANESAGFLDDFAQ